MPWYMSLYLKLNDKTRQRDLRGLRKLELAFVDGNNTIWPGHIRHEKRCHGREAQQRHPNASVGFGLSHRIYSPA